MRWSTRAGSRRFPGSRSEGRSQSSGSLAKRALGRSLAVFGLALLVSVGDAEPSPATEPVPRLAALVAEPGRIVPFRVFSWMDGLPQHTTWSMAEDSEGFVWAGTHSGAARYDGDRWRPLELPGGRTKTLISALLATRDGAIWLATDLAGVVRREASGTLATELGRGAGLDHPVALTQLGRFVFAAGEEGLARCTPAGCERLTPLDGRRILSLAPGTSPGGTSALWVGGPWGVVRLDDPEGARPRIGLTLDTAAGFPGSRANVLAETVWAQGKRALWVGTDRGLARWCDDRWRMWDAAAGIPAGQIRALLPQPGTGGEPLLWVGVFGEGLFAVWPDDRTSRLDKNRGLPENFVYSLLETGREQGRPTLWVGTASRGVARVDYGRWITLDANDGLPDRVVIGIGECLFPDGERSVWIGTIGGAVRRTSRGFERFGIPGLPEPLLVYAAVETVAADGASESWFATSKGLHRFARGQWTAFRADPDGLPADPVLALLAVSGPAGRRLWIGTNSGLARLDGETLVRESGIPSEAIMVLAAAPDPDGNPDIWIGTQKGAWRIREGRAEAVALPGLVAPKVTGFRVIRGADGRDRLWIASLQGAARLSLPKGDDVEILTEATAPPLPDATLYRVEADRAGRAYLFSNQGVIRVTEDPRRPGLEAAGIEHFGLAEGLAGLEFNRASWVDPLGRIWGGSVAGAVLLDPAFEATKTAPEALRLQAEETGARALPLRSGASLVWNHGPLVFRYSLLSFNRESAIRFRTQLIGLEEAPGELRSEREVRFTRLPPGSYTFRVVGRSAAGVDSNPIEIGFKVESPPWRSPLAAIAYLSGLAFLAVAIGRWRSRALRARAARLELLVTERTRELEQAREKLDRAHSRIASLQEPGGGVLEDTSRWAHRVATEVAKAIAARSIDVWALDNEGISPVAAEGPPPAELEELRSALQPVERTGADGRTILPVLGLTGEIRGALVIDGPDVRWDEAARRLVAAFARHLGSALDLVRLRGQLTGIETRRADARRQMHERGIETAKICPLCGACLSAEADSCPADGHALVPTLLPLRIQGRYFLRSRLGEGGMGTVFHCVDERLNRDVAVKVVDPSSLDDPAVRFRLEREAHTIARIHHPGVVAIHDTGELDDGSVFLVMERLEGRDLAAVIRRWGKGTPRQVASLLRQAGAALAAAHQLGIVHRDVKPANVFLTPSGPGFHVRVLDFGLAKATANDGRLTQTGCVVGTPAYMSPEQVLGREVDSRGDLYSLAVVAWEALAGQSLVASLDVASILLEVAHAPAPRLSIFFPTSPPALDAAFARALAKEAERRPSNLEAWVDEVVSLLQELPEGTGGWPSPMPGPTEPASGRDAPRTTRLDRPREPPKAG